MLFRRIVKATTDQVRNTHEYLVEEWNSKTGEKEAKYIPSSETTCRMSESHYEKQDEDGDWVESDRFEFAALKEAAVAKSLKKKMVIRRKK